MLTWQKLVALGQQQLAKDLATTALAAAPLFERGFEHWERAGIVERVHHAGSCAGEVGEKHTRLRFYQATFSRQTDRIEIVPLTLLTKAVAKLTEPDAAA